jgi:hypothetical protein
MATALLDTPSFNPDEESESVPIRWQEYLDSVEMALLACGLTNDKRKWAFLQHSAGRKIQRIEKQLTYDKTEGETYKALHKALTAHF